MRKNGYCQISDCESPAMETVRVSENNAGDSHRHLCYPCHEAYMVGMQHKSFTEVKPLVVILREFLCDVESVGKKETLDEWPDIFETYLKAFKLLHGGKHHHDWHELPDGKATHFTERCLGCGTERSFAAREDA